MTRAERLMPNGIPRWIRVYDNEGESYDRWSCLFTGRYEKKAADATGNWWIYIGMSEDPFHPQGFGITSQIDSITAPDCGPPGGPIVPGWPPKIGRRGRWGKRIRFEDLNERQQRAVVDVYRMIWGLLPDPVVSSVEHVLLPDAHLGE